MKYKYTDLNGGTVNRIAADLNVQEYGAIKWVIHDDKNNPIEIEIDKLPHVPTYHVDSYVLKN